MGNIMNMSQRKPPGASCGFIAYATASVDPVQYWRDSNYSHSSCVFGKLVLILDNLSSDATFTLSLTMGGASSPGASYISGAPSTCGTLGTYMNAVPALVAGLIIDIWQALIDGVWSSSISFTFTYRGGGYIFTYPSYITGGGVAGIPNQAIPLGVSPGAVTACVGTSTKTVTVYDDGNVTIT